MALPFEFDFRQPDYARVYEHRARMLQLLSDPNCLAAAKQFYKDRPGAFITDWGCTFDPRNVDIGLPVRIPFILFPKQEEWVTWMLDRWKNRKNGIVEKSRDMGMSWLCVALFCTLCIFYEDMVIGLGSRKEEYVDRIGDPKSLFWKARMFMETLPPIFTGGYSPKRDSPHMRLMIPATGSIIVGEAGDNIGRGNRTGIYLVDESAHLERPALVDASLSQTTNCRIDLSTPRGTANPFAVKRFSGKIAVFTFFWRDDPRKDEAWYAEQVEKLDPVSLAQEVDMNYNASLEGVVIPGEWVIAAVNSAAKLGIEVTGRITAALDVADQGTDLNAHAVRKGIELLGITAWSGKDSDTLYTTEKAFYLCDEFDAAEMQYDADGIGALVRGDGRAINSRRLANKERQLELIPFRGSGEVIAPEKDFIKGRKNKDYFANRKAQQWWKLRKRFQNTFRAVRGELPDFDKDDLISIPGNLKELAKLQIELSQPTYTINAAGKILIDKTPNNTKSPNYADATMMVYSDAKRGGGLFTAKG